ncbi:MAG: hypothetical protein QGG64_11045, partial [Candidatus Latescibacteria bacterium]|nr:hypothetical protein [Candidatus Latescibacterota bacterium]
MDLPKIDYTRKNVGKNIAELLDSVGDKGGEGMGSGIINPPESALEQTVPVWITDQVIRGKNPGVDLRKQYGHVFRICTAIALIVHVVVAVVF